MASSSSSLYLILVDFYQAYLGRKLTVNPLTPLGRQLKRLYHSSEIGTVY